MIVNYAPAAQLKQGRVQKIQKRIEIVRSTTRALSSLSQESCDALQAVLSRHYAAVGVSIVNDMAGLERLVAKRPDLAFMGLGHVLHNGRPVWVSTHLEERGINCTASNRHAMLFERDKSLAKQRVLDAGLQTAASVVIKQGQTNIATTLALPFPLFAKPASLGGGVGVDEHSVIRTVDELSYKLQSLSEHYADDILLETYLPGREFSVAIIKQEFSDELIAMPIELVAQRNARGDSMLSQEVKSSNAEVVLPVTDPLVRKQVSELALAVFHTLGARDYGRIDIRMDGGGVPHFLEANLLPSLIDGYGSFPKACLLNLGMDYERMALYLTRLGLAHTSQA